MGGISVKAFVISNIVCVAILVALVGAAGFMGLALEFEFMRQAATQGAQPTMDAAAAAFTSSAALTVLIAISFSAAYLSAGYLAGLLAAYAKPLNGALSSTFFVLLSAYMTFFGEPSELFGLHLHHHEHGQLFELVGVVFGWGGPIFGLAGGFLAERIDGRSAGRWVLAVPASIGAYWLVMILAVSFHSPRLLIWAAAAAIFAASAIVPAAHRLAAYITFSILVIATGFGLQWWRATAIGAPLSYTNLIYNGGGAICALILGNAIMARLRSKRPSSAL